MSRSLKSLLETLHVEAPTQRRLAVLTLSIISIAVWSSAARAQQPQGVARAVETVLASPEDPEASFLLARAAAENGDLAGAADALERVLRLEPNLPNVHLELGIIYLRLDAPALAEEHLRRALAFPGMPPSIRPRAEYYLEVAADRLRRNVVRGSLSAGIRNDSNVNASPTSPEVYVFGFPALLDSAGVEFDDSSLFADFGLEHRFWFDQEGRMSLQTNARYLVSDYADATTFDSRILDADTGPAFLLDVTDAPTSVRPFVSASHFSLDGETYLNTHGAGVEVETTLRSGLGFFATIERMERTFSATTERPFVEDRSGDLENSSVGIVYRFRTGWEFVASRFRSVNDAAALYESYDSDGQSIAVIRYFRGFSAALWNVSFAAAKRDTDYRASDPQVAPFLTRSDERVDVLLSLDAPITERLALKLVLDQTDNESSIPNTDFDNEGSALSFRWSF